MYVYKNNVFILPNIFFSSFQKKTKSAVTLDMHVFGDLGNKSDNEVSFFVSFFIPSSLFLSFSPSLLPFLPFLQLQLG